MNDLNRPRVEAVPDDGYRIEPQRGASPSPEALDSAFAEREPRLHEAYIDVLQALGADLIPSRMRMKLWEALPASTKREIIGREGSLDTISLSMFKQQMTMVDNIMRQLFSPDGIPQSTSEFGLTHKEAMNLWLRLNQMMTRDLPKVITMERVQRIENALTQVMAETMTQEQQSMVFERLESIERNTGGRG